MKRLVKIAALAMLTAVAAGCDHQRDLWVHGSAELVIDGDWVPSLREADMTGRATSKIYKSGGGVLSTDFFDAPRRVKYRMPDAGVYEALILNGLIFSDEVTNLSGISLRNTDRLETFEAVVVRQTESLPGLISDGSEYLASRDMEVLTSAAGQIEVDGSGGYRIKYKNGVEQYLDDQNDGEVVLELIPRPVSWPAKVVVHLIKAGSMASAAGSLKGFTGSVFMADGTPSHMRVTHQLPLGDIVLDETSPPDRLIGTISSPVFVTFGPPTDLGADTDWPFRFDLSIELRDGSMFEGVYDISQQIAPIVEKLRGGQWYDPALHPITIEIGPVELPDVESSVNLDQWEDSDEITIIPVTN